MKRVHAPIAWLAVALAGCQVPNPAYDGVPQTVPFNSVDSGGGVFANGGASGTGLLDGGFLGPDGSSVDVDAGTIMAADAAIVIDAFVGEVSTVTPDAPPMPDDAPSTVGVGLVVYVPANEGSGGTLADLAGGPSLSASGAHSWIPGHTGAAADKAIRFTNGGWAGTAPAPAAPEVLNLSGKMSVAAWLFWETPSADVDQTIVGYIGKDWYFRMGTSTFPRACFTIRASGSFGACGTVDVPIKTWTHVAATWDGAFIRLYINGVEDTSARLATRGTIGNFDRQYLSIGALGMAGNPLEGALSEFRIYNRALQPSEVAALAR